MKERCGIFGGSFNPVHLGHLLLAEQAMEQCGLDRVLFIPTYISPFKTGMEVAASEDRLAMLRLATEGQPRFMVSDREIREEQISYTILTMEALRREEPDTEHCLVMGADSFLSLESWHRGPALLREYPILAGGRPGSDQEDMEKAAELWHHRYDSDIRFFRLPLQEISSSDIRLRLSEGKSVRYMVPDSVLEYIENRGLYRK